MLKKYLLKESRHHLLQILVFIFVWSIFSANAVNDIDKERFYSIINEVPQKQEMQRTQTIQMIKQLYAIAHTHSDSLVLLSECFYQETYTNYLQSCYDSSLLSKGESILKMLDTEINLFQKALIQLGLGFHYTTKGDYAEAFISSLHALDIFTKLDKPDFMEKTCLLLGDIFTYIKNYKMAEDYFSRIILSSQPSSPEYYQSILGLAKVFFMTGHADRATNMFLELIPELEQQKDTAYLVSIYLKLGACYHFMNEPEKAYKYYEKTLELIQKVDNTRILFALYQNLATYYAAYTDEFLKAIYYYMQAKDIAVYNNNNLEQLSYVYHGLSATYEKDGNSDSAYHYLKESNSLQNQLFNNAKTLEAYQGYVSVMLESSQKELTIAAQEISLKKRQFIITVISAVAIILLAVLFLFIIQQKRRTLAKRIEQDEQIQKLQEEKIKSQLRELSSHALLLSGKNEILQQIEERIKNLPDSSDEIKEIKQIVKNNLKTDQAWESFILHFDKVHPSFFEKLKAHTPVLTENSLKLCAYFRIGLSTKEVAQILNTTVGAVKRSRNRLKNKMGLIEKDNLDDFLRNV